MELHNPLIKGTFILTVTGLLTRFMGFFYRIFLSHTFGAVQVGLYQLIFPIYVLFESVTLTSVLLCVLIISLYPLFNIKNKKHVCFFILHQ